MALNKFMHPRNRYKDNRPDFDELAKKYPNFKRFVISNQSGKATLDFHDPEALRALTCTLLKEDFGIEIKLPLDRLIPTVALRLNYIHWIEDLLNESGHAKSSVFGIDIGCGASCIYPLLGAKMNGWTFLTSEVDDLALHYARDNIEINGLADKITVVRTTEDSMICGLLNSAPIQQPQYDFTMCNPPFFGNMLEAQGIMSSRPSRPDPKSVSTAGELEMIAEGGEVEFVRRMIAESLELQTQIVWYTSMLGKKSSVAVLKEELRRNKIHNVTFTEFCQGRTMRWGIAWTFYEDIKPPLPASKKRKLEQQRPPLVIPVPDPYIKAVVEASSGGGLQSKIQAVAMAIQCMMEKLEMHIDRKPTSKWCAKFALTASHDTWSHQRRKRRREKQKRKEVSNPPSSSGVAIGSSVVSLPMASDTQLTMEHAPQPSTSSSIDTASSLVTTSLSSQVSGKNEECSSEPCTSSSLVTASASGSTYFSSSKVSATNKEHSSGPSPTSSSVTASSLVTTSSSNSQASITNKEYSSTSRNSQDNTTTHQHSLVSSLPPFVTYQNITDSDSDSPVTGFRTNVKKRKADDSSSHDSDDEFPLELDLVVKLGEKRTIVMEVNVRDNKNRDKLHQVVQYIKNQMK